jgi:ketosteroid isomerase-like protein
MHRHVAANVMPPLYVDELIAKAYLALIAGDGEQTQERSQEKFRITHAIAEDQMDNLTRTNADAARRLFEAVENRNPQGVAAIYHERIVIHEAPSLPYGGEYHGHEGALRHGQGFRATWDRFQTSKARGLDPRFVAQGDYVAVLWRHKAENRETGGRIDLPAAGAYRFMDGMVIDSRMFHFDIAA